MYEDEVPEVIEEIMNEETENNDKLIPKKKKQVIEKEEKRKAYENKKKEIGEKIMDCIDINRIKNIQGLSIISSKSSGYAAAGRNPNISKYAIKNPVIIPLKTIFISKSKSFIIVLYNYSI